jgi:hypothetical protein
MKNSCLMLLLALSACGFAQALKPVAVPNPAVAGSIQPNWAVAADGSALLSWVEPTKGGGYTLRYAVRAGRSGAIRRKCPDSSA